MAERTVSEKKLHYMEFIHRETGYRHQTDDEDVYPFELLRAGDPAAVDAAVRMFSSDVLGHVSDDPVRNRKYLFVSAVTVACRTAIQAGMDRERAYNSSDLFILRMDELQTVEEVKVLYKEMFTFYTEEVARLDKKNIFSKPITLCLDYIYEHLHEPIRIVDLADEVGLTQNYLSTLFKKETGRTVSEYVSAKRMEAAENMLRFSNYSSTEIGTILTFSSQSHFIQAFKKHTGYTPKQYRDKFFRQRDIKNGK